MTSKAERYVSNQEKVKTRAIFAIFKQQKEKFVQFLLKKPQKSVFNLEYKEESLEDYLKEISGDIPDYLEEALPPVMTQGAKESIKRYKDLLPKGYALVFDIPGTPAADYVKNLVDLYLSEKQGSILKTTRDELRRIIADGIEAGQSYTEIAKQIQETDPFVFNKARAKLIAVNEVGRAYGWANHQPAVELENQGYVLEKKWVTSHDLKVRPAHNANEGNGFIPLNQAFSGTGDQYAPSSIDYNCRCTSYHQIVAIKSLLTPGTKISLLWKSILEIQQIFVRERKRDII